MKAKPRIGFVAPSSVVPPYEFELGLNRIRAAGFDVQVHPQCKKRHLFFAGNDEERASAFLEMAMDPAIDILWCARGGYGSYRLLPILDRMMAGESRRPPQKLLAGYSDTSCLFDFVRLKWGWSVLHAPMPGLISFTEIKRPEFEALLAWTQGERPRSKPFGGKTLKFYGKPPQVPVESPVVGGNLAVVSTLIGTPYQIDARGKMLFLEDVGETWSRIDVMLHRLLQSGEIDGVRAILLGDFKNCRDAVSQALVAPKKGSKAKPKPAPIRPEVSQNRYFNEVFTSISECYRIPVAYGLPIGHGPGKYSLPIGGEYRLGTGGQFELLQWDGLKN